ncbi:hypothetical protein [Bradyrhizobium sp. OAE829]|uniref:hypothetical protein n=1 Tax=Bradyrhizobium sp. OAE829 TaxID=2663807 RepID=UPI00178A6779
MRKEPPDRKIQLREIGALEKRIATRGLLDQTRDDFLIDAFALGVGRSKRELRSDVEEIGRNAVMVAAMFLRTIPSERELALRMLTVLKNVDNVAKPLRTKDASDFASAFVNPVPGPGQQFISANQVWTKINELVKELHELRQRAEHFELVEPLAGRSEMLARAFVMQMREFYERRTGRRAPKARSGKLVDLMQAAWDDLQFPAIPETRLGHILETLPR